MGKPKHRTTSRRTGTRRANEVLDLARRVNSKSPVKARTTVRESGRLIKASAQAENVTTVKKVATPKKATKVA